MAGLANFNPYEGQTIRKDSAGSRILLYIYQKGQNLFKYN